MEQYTTDEKKFIRMIVDKARSTDLFFQLLVSEHFVKNGSRPLMVNDTKNKKVILLFSEGKRHEEFYRFMNLVALIEDLEKDRLIIRLPVDPKSTYFVGELGDAREEIDDSGITGYFSPSTGKYLNTQDLSHLHSRKDGTSEIIDPVMFDDPKTADRLINAFSGIVYPRETLRILVKNDFQSVGKIRHRHAMVAAWSAIATSLILALLALIKSCSA